MPSRYAPFKKPESFIINPVLDVLSSFGPMSTDLRNAFLERAFEVKLKKGSFLIKSGETSKYLYFLVSGIIAGYRTKGNESLTTFICVDGEFVSAIVGMYGTAPSEDSMVAEEDSYLIGLRSTDLLYFFDTYPEMNIIMRRILELYYKVAHERAVNIRMGSAKEKYEYYLRSLPGQFDKVPVELVASYLDMKGSTLEKIKKEMESTRSTNLLLLLPKLQEVMQSEQLFRKKRITLGELSAHLQIGTHHLSHLLNQHYGKNFQDFINQWRVDFVVDLLSQNDALQYLTIEAIGLQAGFSSKSTFFAAFKKEKGCSPLKYIKTLSPAEM
ncbi:helix-turn-helix domain-containing protein [Pedobacter nutrimenti]|uniref:CRP-like cAMP-binding protein n=1 Tax=Pedobacter nutrimenti TaxID=1241337 RepID=A0A318UJK7_9SPHI|nr:helix-turn-helix domain-containing protein [Pedobacter nutrimenti]PYF76532.1 CRP-like cAMP-binding protein [Pedobacter nutrimenti]